MTLVCRRPFHWGTLPRPRHSDAYGHFPGNRLAILTNGGGIGVLAVDRLADLGGSLAEIAPETMKRLDAALPPIRSRANPVDIAGDADAARYTAAFEALLGDPQNDAVLVMNVPTRSRRRRPPQHRSPLPRSRIATA
jgi:acyl-CoA synthetase (NDP forming)